MRALLRTLLLALLLGVASGAAFGVHVGGERLGAAGGDTGNVACPIGQEWTPRVATGGPPVWGEDRKKACKYDGRASNGDKKGMPCADAIGFGACGPAAAFDCYCCPFGCLASWMGDDTGGTEGKEGDTSGKAGKEGKVIAEGKFIELGAAFGAPGLLARQAPTPGSSLRPSPPAPP